MLEQVYNEVMQLINNRTNDNNIRRVKTIINKYYKAYGYINEIEDVEVLHNFKNDILKVVG